MSFYAIEAAYGFSSIERATWPPKNAAEPPTDDKVTLRNRIDGANRYWFVSRKSHANLPLRPKTHDSSGAVSRIFFRRLVQTTADYLKNKFRGVSKGRADFSYGGSIFSCNAIIICEWYTPTHLFNNKILKKVDNFLFKWFKFCFKWRL